jgi:hypothetical protein
MTQTDVTESYPWLIHFNKLPKGGHFAGSVQLD